ncbi:MAG: histidine phosphatase family protein, partial [Acidimicrobiales bacterium]
PPTPPATNLHDHTKQLRFCCSLLTGGATPPTVGSVGLGEIFLLRHGRTGLNAAGVLRGRLDEPLDDVGVAEASALGRELAEVPLSAILTSPLQRAVHTARAVARFHPHLEVVLDADLADRDWGSWAGKPLADLVAAYGEVDTAPDVEPRAAFDQRVAAAFERAARRAEEHGSTVALVAHDAVNRAILDKVAGPPAREWTQPTGCWNQIVLTPRGWVTAAVGRRPPLS